MGTGNGGRKKRRPGRPYEGENGRDRKSGGNADLRERPVRVEVKERAKGRTHKREEPLTSVVSKRKAKRGWVVKPDRP